ncbi:MAG: MBL fold metallo-hydrolase [Kiritimatiellia bacterium]
MKFHFLGTACGRPTAQRFNSSTAIEHDGRLIMIDCGEPCTALLKRQGLSPGDVTDILITHMHADHVTGLPMLLREITKCRRNGESSRPATEATRLYVPAHVNPGIMDAVQLLCGTDRGAGMAKGVQIESLRDGAEYDLDGLRVSSIANRHDGLESYAFFIRVAGLRIFHSGDLPGSFNPIAPFLQDLDLLITEAAHLPTTAYQALNGKNIKQVVISHIRWKHHGQEDQLVASLAEQLAGTNFSLAEDGMTLTL